jgi:AcrR family transcriptional regulator
VATGATGQVATRAVATGEEQHDDEQEDQDGHDDPGYLHPAWHARGRSAVGRHAGVLAWVASAGRVSHVRLLCRACCHDHDSLSRQDGYLKAGCFDIVITYTAGVPRLWDDTIQAHRHQVREAILDTTAALVATHGLLAVTMSQIAAATGIGRATLYKYFPDVEAILLAWHQRQISGHLDQLAEVRDQAGDADQRLEAVLEAYALIAHQAHGHRDSELAAFLHRDQHVTKAEQQLRDMLQDLLTQAAATGKIRGDVAPSELARYCLHALAAAGSLPSRAAVRRLVTVTVAGLRPPR